MELIIVVTGLFLFLIGVLWLDAFRRKQASRSGASRSKVKNFIYRLACLIGPRPVVGNDGMSRRQRRKLKKRYP